MLLKRQAKGVGGLADILDSAYSTLDEIYYVVALTVTRGGNSVGALSGLVDDWFGHEDVGACGASRFPHGMQKVATDFLEVSANLTSTSDVSVMAEGDHNFVIV